MKNKKVAVVFPGQGSQRIGMAKDFVEKFEISKKTFELASEVLDCDMMDLCFCNEEKLNQIESMQPAIMTAEIAMLKAVQNVLEFEPAFFAGHSMGEYTAIVAAGVMPFEDGLKLVKGRNALMQHSVPEGSGTMLALIQQGLKETGFEKITEACGVEVANLNSPNQVVLAGLNAPMAEAHSRLAAAFPEMRIVPLGINLPFHCSLMSSVEPELAKYLEQFRPKLDLSRAGKVISNLTGTFHSAETLIENVVKQISGCVQWCKNMDVLGACAEEILEIGPNKVLGRFFRDSGYNAHSVINLRSLEKLQQA